MGRVVGDLVERQRFSALNWLAFVSKNPCTDLGLDLGNELTRSRWDLQMKGSNL